MKLKSHIIYGHLYITDKLLIDLKEKLLSGKKKKEKLLDGIRRSLLL